MNDPTCQRCGRPLLQHGDSHSGTCPTCVAIMATDDDGYVGYGDPANRGKPRVGGEHRPRRRPGYQGRR